MLVFELQICYLIALFLWTSVYIFCTFMKWSFLGLLLQESYTNVSPTIVQLHFKKRP